MLESAAARCVTDYATLDRDLAKIHEDTAELVDFLERCELLRAVCNRSGLADVVGAAQRRAAVLVSELKRLEAIIRDSDTLC